MAGGLFSMAHPAITLSGIAGKQPLDRSMTPGYGGDIQMLQFVWPFPAAFYFLFYGILTCITFLWFSIHSGVVRSARFCAPVFRHDDCLRSPSFSNPSFSSFAPLHCRAHTPFIVPVVGMHAAHTGQPTVLSITDQIILGYM